jgi:hypothetical protein
MATLAITFTAGSNAGAQIRKLSQRLDELSYNVPDNASTGAATVVTVDNAPASGTVSVQITGGPYPSSLYIV